MFLFVVLVFLNISHSIQGASWHCETAWIAVALASLPRRGITLFLVLRLHVALFCLALRSLALLRYALLGLAALGLARFSNAFGHSAGELQL